MREVRRLGCAKGRRVGLRIVDIAACCTCLDSRILRGDVRTMVNALKALSAFVMGDSGDLR